MSLSVGSHVTASSAITCFASSAFLATVQPRCLQVDLHGASQSAATQNRVPVAGRFKMTLEIEEDAAGWSIHAEATSARPVDQTS